MSDLTSLSDIELHRQYEQAQSDLRVALWGIHNSYDNRRGAKSRMLAITEERLRRAGLVGEPAAEQEGDRNEDHVQA